MLGGVIDIGVGVGDINTPRAVCTAPPKTHRIPIRISLNFLSKME